MKNSFSFKRIWVLILLPITLVFSSYTASDPRFCEEYARNIYPVVSGVLNHLFSISPVSVAEILILVFAGLMAVYFVGTVFRIIFGHDRLKKFILLILNILCLISFVYFVFFVTCGINYYRVSFTETAKFDVRQSTVDELKSLFQSIVFKLNEACEVSEETDFSEMATEAKAAMERLSNDFPTLSGDYGVPKSVNFFGLMSYSQITGFFFPFTYEANVNDTIPKISLPVTMCHELAHVRGYMREDEANFIAYLACMRSENPFFVYSGLLLAYSHTASAIYSVSPDDYYEISSQLSEKVKTDLSKKSEYWQAFEGFFAEVSDTVNDTYLKINNQKDGVKSYGRMVDLLLAEQRMTQ